MSAILGLFLKVVLGVAFSGVLITILYSLAGTAHLVFALLLPQR